MACALKMIWLLFFAGDSIWSSWFISEILEGDLDWFWVINTKQKYSWLVNKLLDARDIIYPWIKKIIHNGETTYFWSSNWSLYGKLSDYLRPAGAARFPIYRRATIADSGRIDRGTYRMPVLNGN